MTENEMTTEEKGSGNFPKTYIQLRTVLDGLEITALRYCLEKKDNAERVKRAEEIIGELMPIIREYQSKLRMSVGGGVCAEGFFECNGCCVPYPCPYSD